MRANSQLDSFRGFARMPLTVLYIRSSTRVMLPNYFHRLLISIIEMFSTIHALANLATRRDATGDASTRTVRDRFVSPSLSDLSLFCAV